MPELPDVETFKRYVDSTSLHKRIAHTRVLDEDMLDGVSRQSISGSLTGKRIEETRRHGKYLAAHAFDDGWLVLHFGMTGDLSADRGDREDPDHEALRLEFEDGSRLSFTCPRRFGGVGMTGSVDELIEEKGLGLDALDLDGARFKGILSERSGAIKPLLMNQSVMAGIGNVYSDEMLFRAGVHPERSAGDLSVRECEALYLSMRHVLQTAINRHADPDRMPDSWMLPHRHAGASCPRCDGEIRRSTVGGRSAHFCPSCQS